MSKRFLAIILAATTAIGMAVPAAAATTPSATITVTESNEDADVKTVTLDKSNETIAVESELVITATISASATVGTSEDKFTVSASSGSSDVVEITKVATGGDATLGASTLNTKKFTVKVTCKGLKPGTSVITVNTTKQENGRETTPVTPATCTVTVEKTLSSIALGDLSSIAPTVGGTPATTISAPEGTSLSGNLSWKVKDGSALAAGASFETGKQYQAELTLKPSANYKFDSNVAITISAPGGATASGAKDSDNLKVTVTFPAIPASGNQQISGTQTVNITAPAAGAAPQTSITPPANTTISDVAWTDKEGATVGSSFQNGKQYKVSFKLSAASGYEFANGVSVDVPGAQPSTTWGASQLSVSATFPTIGNTDRQPSVSSQSVRYDRRTGGDIVLTIANGTGEYKLGSGITVKNGTTALVRDTDFKYEPITGSDNQRLTLLDSYLRTLPAGTSKLDVSISPANTATVGANWAISVDVYTSSNPSTGNTTGNSSKDDDDDERYGRVTGSSGGSSGGSTVSPNVAGTSSNVSPLTGAVKETTAVKDVEKALENASASDTSVNVTVRNAKSITAGTLDSMADAIGGAEKAVVLHADKVQNGKVVSRLYIDVEKAAELGKDLNLDVSIGNKQVEKLFDKYFANDISVVSFGQKGSFGMEIGVAVKVDLSKLDVKNLVFYNYNPQTNSYVRVQPKFYIDQSGYLHFSTASGGNMIVTDSALKKK